MLKKIKERMSIYLQNASQNNYELQRKVPSRTHLEYLSTIDIQLTKYTHPILLYFNKHVNPSNNFDVL